MAEERAAPETTDERLRTLAAGYTDIDRKWLMDAADEIERLMDERDRLADKLERRKDLGFMLKNQNGALLSQVKAVEEVAKGYGWTEDAEHEMGALGFIFDHIKELEARLEYRPGFPDGIDCRNAAIDELGLERDQLRALLADERAAPPALEWSATLLDGRRVNFDEAETAVAELGGGWRLPTRRELEPLLDLTRHDPAIDADKYPDTKSTWYWTSTKTAWDDTIRWVVGFRTGLVSLYHRDSLACVRAVRDVREGE